MPRLKIDSHNLSLDIKSDVPIPLTASGVMRLLQSLKELNDNVPMKSVMSSRVAPGGTQYTYACIAIGGRAWNEQWWVDGPAPSFTMNVPDKWTSSEAKLLDTVCVELLDLTMRFGIESAAIKW